MELTEIEKLQILQPKVFIIKIVIKFIDKRGALKSREHLFIF